MTAVARLDESYASEVDAFRHGEYVVGKHAGAAFSRAVDLRAEPGRHHLYVGWASTRSHHIAILRSILGLDGVVSLSYVDGLRDGRGWAFRERTGPDPVNGFTLLREAYLQSGAGSDAEARVPLLWDRAASVIVSDDAETIATDLLAAAGPQAGFDVSALARAEVGRLERSFMVELNAAAALLEPGRRGAFRESLTSLDRRLAASRYLTGARLSDADLRLWVRLARYDAGPNASGAITRRLDQYPNLWRWAQAVWELPGVRANTDFSRFAAPFADLPPWKRRSTPLAQPVSSR